jgi:PPOX class probable F420-dependent enzyme
MRPVPISRLAKPPRWARQLLETARVARLGLLDADGHPRVLPVTFAVAEGKVWSAVDEKPKRDPDEELARVRFLRRDARAALTVDRYADDWRELAWVQVLGEVEVLEPDEADAGLAALVGKYPQYRRSEPGGPLLALSPRRFLWWSAAEAL